MRLIVEDALRGLIEDFQAGNFSVEAHPVSHRATKPEMRQTLISCLLSSGWKYEKAIDAAKLFVGKFPALDDAPPLDEVEAFLSDSRVRHRFPRSKAKQLHSSLSELANFPVDMIFQGSDIKGERIIRDIVQRRFPGLGYKQTSMFMRNVGAAKRLAVIDSHIVWYLRNCLSIESGNLTPKRYIFLEDMINGVTESFNVDLNSFDVILWVLVREFKKSERTKLCGTQYVLPLAA